MPINLKKATFYLKKDNEHIGFEANVKYKEHRYSIELDEHGRLFDIDSAINLCEIPEKVSETVINSLKNTCEHHKIEKIQEYVIPANTRNAFEERKNTGKYALTVTTKNKEINCRQRKYVFDSTGKEPETRKAIRRSYEFHLF